MGMRVFIVNPSLGTEWNSQTALTLLPPWPSWGLACCWPWDQCRHHHRHHSCLPVATGTANSTLLPSPTWLRIPPFLPCPSGRNNLADALLPATSRALCKDGNDSWWLNGLQSTAKVTDARRKLKERNNLLSRASKTNIPSPLLLIPHLLQKLVTVI